MQLRRSPEGNILKSRRRRPLEPPSSVTETIAVKSEMNGAWGGSGLLTKPDGCRTRCFRPRRRVDRPVPPPMVTTLTGLMPICFIPARTSSSTHGNSIVVEFGTNVGIGTFTPVIMFYVNGVSTLRGAFSLLATAATLTAAINSSALQLGASSYPNTTNPAVPQGFLWQAVNSFKSPANPSANLTLLFGSGTTTPAATGLSIDPNGQITFAPGQTFPGVSSSPCTGGASTTHTGVTVSIGLTGGDLSRNVTPALSMSIAATNAGTGATPPAGALANLDGLPLAGGTLTGSLNGISASFLGNRVADTIVSSSSPTINALAYGVSTASSDNSAALTKALTAAYDAQSRLVLPAGTYRIASPFVFSVLSQKSTATTQGFGIDAQDGTILQYTGPTLGANITAYSLNTVSHLLTLTASNNYSAGQIVSLEAPFYRVVSVTTTGSANITVAAPSGIVAGQIVTGVGVPSNTTVLSVSGSTVTISNAIAGTVAAVITTADTTLNSPTVTVTSASNLFYGQIVTGTGIAAGTTVLSVVGTTVTLSQNAIASNSGVTLSFTGVPLQFSDPLYPLNSDDWDVVSATDNQFTIALPPRTHSPVTLQANSGSSRAVAVGAIVTFTSTCPTYTGSNACFGQALRLNINNLIIDGQGTTGIGLRVEGAGGSKLNGIRVRNVTGAGSIGIECGDCEEFTLMNPTVSVVDNPNGTFPSVGLQFNSSNCAQPYFNGTAYSCIVGHGASTTDTIISPKLEGIPGPGLVVSLGTSGVNVIGGTSEGNQYGIITNAQGGTYIGIDLENNSVQDVLDTSYTNHWDNLASTSGSKGKSGVMGIELSNTALYTNINGGIVANLQIDAGAAYVAIKGTLNGISLADFGINTQYEATSIPTGGGTFVNVLSGLTIRGNLSVTGTVTPNVGYSASGAFTRLLDQGSCTMSSGACSAITLNHTYPAAPVCFVQWTGIGALTGILKAPTTSTTITPASSVGTDTAQVNWGCFGK